MAATGTYSGYSEIVHSQESPTGWKEISLSSGTGNSIQAKKVKFSDTAGGFSYANSDHLQSVTRNRFIYWRVIHDVVELSEVSLDFNLVGNQLRVLFHGVPVVSVQVFETPTLVVFLVVTATSVHRFQFPHPCRLQSHDVHSQNIELGLPSIFTESASCSINDPANIHVFATTGSYAHSGAAITSVVTSAEGLLKSDGSAVYVIALQSASLLIISMPRFGSQGCIEQREIKQSVISRFWNGLPAIIRGSQDSSGDITSALCLHPFHNDVYIFGVSRCGKLRTWSSMNTYCLLAVDLLDHIVDHSTVNLQAVSGTTYIVRKSVNVFGTALFVCVYISFGDSCQFVVYELPLEGSIECKHKCTICGPQGSLIDYHLTPTQLWSLWYRENGEPAVKFVSFTSDGPATFGWIDVVMSKPLSDQLDISPSNTLDPRELYIGEIFHPNRFSVEVLLKALNIFRRTPDASYLNEAQIPVRELKQEVSEAVQSEIRRAVNEYELEESKFVELQSRQWARFYSICVQYQQRGVKPLGLLSDSATGLVGVVTRSGINYVEPMHVIERLYVFPPLDTRNSVNSLSAVPQFDENVELCHNVDFLMSLLRIISQALKGEAEFCFEQDLHYTAAEPLQLALNCVDFILSSTSSEIKNNISARLREISQFVPAVELVIDLLDVSRQFVDNLSGDSEEETNSPVFDVSHLFSSSAGMCVLCQSVRQTADTRLALCRDLLVVLLLVEKLGDAGAVALAQFEDFRARLIVYIRSYYLVKWSALTPALPASSAVADSVSKQLDLLRLEKMPDVIALHRLGDRCVTLLELFLRSSGGNALVNQLVQNVFYDAERFEFWTAALPAASHIANQLLWPSLPFSKFLFPLSLFGQCQFLAIQDYVRLIQCWCDIDSASRYFMLALSYLHSNEFEKAIDCFKLSTSRLMEEEFLINLMSNVARNTDPRHREVLYYLQVVHLLEMLEMPELVVTMVRMATKRAEPDDPNVPTLWSKLFKCQLELGHSHEAYEAMLSNPDASRRKGCLHQFIIVLCERNELGLLIESTYRDSQTVLESDVVNIMETRARLFDVMKHKYYDLLYAFHVHRNNYRAAGSIMYEYATKLANSSLGLPGLQRQAKCLLAAINALRLGDAKYAWILKPVTSRSAAGSAVDMETNGDDVDVEMSDLSIAYRLSQSVVEQKIDEIPYKAKRTVDIIELQDIEKEYALVHACIELASKSSAMRLAVARLAVATRSPNEVVALLSDVGLYDKAVNICRLFDLKLDSVLESLTIRCVHLSQSSHKTIPGAVQSNLIEMGAWLEFNELTTECTGDIGVGGAADRAWHLLRTYLERYASSSSQYHRCITVKLFQHGFTLPTWLASSYKRLNAAELLRLYLDYDLLSEASELAVEYIRATLGAGKDYFGLRDYVHSGGPAAWLPYTTLDQLLAALKLARNDHHYSQLYDALNETLDRYFAAVKSATQTMTVNLHR